MFDVLTIQVVKRVSSKTPNFERNVLKLMSPQKKFQNLNINMKHKNNKNVL